MPHVITQNCCNDAACTDACPVNCIHPRPDEPDFAIAEMLYIDPATCIDCGACIPMCPVEAIKPEADLKSDSIRYRELNSLYASALGAPTLRPETPLAIRTLPGSIRVAIIGAGPAGMFAAEHLLTQPGIKVQVDVFDRLPTPSGLIRAGVAPDHQETKAAAEVFRWTARRPGFRYQLGVEIGSAITVSELAGYYHAVIYAVGASSDRHLGIPGEELPGSHAATEFVAWYNGHPDYTDRSFDLSGSRAVIIGNGNVALDVARILTADPDLLATTDIADHALKALRHSKIREVVVIGRRGSAQAGYTTPELLGLTNLAGVDVVIDPAEVGGEGAVGVARLKSGVAREIAVAGASGCERRIVLRYLLSPVEIFGTGSVEGVQLVRNELRPGPDGTLRAHPTDQYERLDTRLVLRSVGYRGTPISGLPFDEDRGIVPNHDGRVEPGVYATGWIKRGPSGVIGTNKTCARETVDALLDDAIDGRLPTPRYNRADLNAFLERTAPNRVHAEGWDAIDQRERDEGRDQGRTRVKFTRIEDLVRVARGGRVDTSR